MDEARFRELMVRSEELRDAFAELMAESLAIREDIRRRRGAELGVASHLATGTAPAEIRRSHRWKV